MKNTNDYITVLTSELVNQSLEYAVARAEGYSICFDSVSGDFNLSTSNDVFKLSKRGCSTDWAKGGPIIGLERISFSESGFGKTSWEASMARNDVEYMEYGSTHLIAAMRCYVAFKIGREIEIPFSIWNSSMPGVEPKSLNSAPKRNKP